MNQADKPPMMRFLELSGGFWMSQAMNVAARLRVADLIANGTQSIAALAQATDTHQLSLYRVLRALASVGVFTETPTKSFGLTPIGEYLRSDNPKSLRMEAMLHGDEWHWRGIGEMLHTVKDGKPGISQLYPVTDYWQYLAQNEEHQDSFNKAMLSISNNYHVPLIDSYDFAPFMRVVDIAGGEGMFLCHVLNKNPHLYGVLFDMPATVENAEHFIESKGLTRRCERISGDMFDSVPPGGDLYMMSYVLIDWDDDNALRVLRNIRDVIKDEGRLLVVDSVVRSGDQYSWAKWVDLFELCMGYGKARTEAEFQSLFHKARFELVRTHEVGTPSSLMELVPKKPVQGS